MAPVRQRLAHYAEVGNRISSEMGCDERMKHCEDAQVVPMKVYESVDRLTVAAPVTGLEPDNIRIEVTPGKQLVLHRSPAERLRAKTWSMPTNGTRVRTAAS